MKEEPVKTTTTKVIAVKLQQNYFVTRVGSQNKVKSNLCKRRKMVISTSSGFTGLLLKMHW